MTRHRLGPLAHPIPQVQPHGSPESPPQSNVPFADAAAIGSITLQAPPNGKRTATARLTRTQSGKDKEGKESKEGRPLSKSSAVASPTSTGLDPLSKVGDANKVVSVPCFIR